MIVFWRHIAVKEQELPHLLDRFLGGLLGMAIGDALGLPVTSFSAREIQSRFGWIRSYLPLPERGQGLDQQTGQFSPDTELALCLVESIVGAGGYLDVAGAGFRAIRLLDGPLGHLLDHPTREALQTAARTHDFQCGVGGPTTRTASPAVRAVVLGLVHSASRVNPELLVRDVLRSTLLTHADPTVVNGALAVAYAIVLLAQGTFPPEVLLGEVISFIDEDEVAKHLRRAQHCLVRLEAGEHPAEVIASLGVGPWIEEVLATAFVSFAARPDDFRESVGLAINLGGASALRGALTGALAGTLLGARQIPDDLLEGLGGRPYIVMAARGLYQAALQRSGRLLRLWVR